MSSRYPTRYSVTIYGDRAGDYEVREFTVSHWGSDAAAKAAALQFARRAEAKGESVVVAKRSHGGLEVREIPLHATPRRAKRRASPNSRKRRRDSLGRFV